MGPLRLLAVTTLVGVTPLISVVAQDLNCSQQRVPTGDAKAQLLLADKYLAGKGVPKDVEKAAEWYCKSAQNGNANAQYRIGYMYKTGTGVPRDLNEAVLWFTKAANQGNAHAQWRLGQAYEEGEGVRQDLGEAVNWFRKAAEQGQPDGLYELAHAYLRGKGVSQDTKEAVRWLRKGAEQDHRESQAVLGATLFYGDEGIEPDRVEGYKWILLAAASGEPVSNKILDELARELSPTQLQDARSRARDWRTQHPRNE